MAPWTALLLGALVCALPAQRPAPRELPRPMEFRAGQDDNLFSLSRSQEDIHDWEKGLEEIAAGDHAGAVARLHKLLQTEVSGVVPVGPGRFLGLRLAVITTLANLSPAGGAAYEALVASEAGNLARRPLATLAQDQLALLAWRFPTAKIGKAARFRLGDLALEAGDGASATKHYRLLFDAVPIGSTEEKLVSARLACARVLVQPRTARAELANETLAAPGREVLEALPAASDPTGYHAAGGGEDGRTPMAVPAGLPEPVWSERISAPGFGFERRDSGNYAMFPVGDLDGIYVNTGRKLVAFDPLRREQLWESRSPVHEANQGDWQSRDYDEQINPDMVLAAACGGDVVVAALQVPERSANVDFHNSFRIISKIPMRRLFAWSRSTGKLLWEHFDELDGPKARRYRGHDSCGPPLILGDTVYAPIHDRSGAIAFAIAAYDLQTGVLKWRRLVCSSQQEVNMFGNARLEFAASPLAIADGVIYGAANLGVAFAVEAATGRIRWVTSHDVVSMPQAQFRHHQQQDRAVFFANNAPVVADHVVCCTPLDSPFVLGLDAENGRILWRVTYDAPVNGMANDVRWLAGALDDEFVLAGRGAVAIKARPDQLATQQADVRQLVRPERLRDRADSRAGGRPAMTADHVWFAAPGRIHAFDRAGNALALDQQIRAPRYQPGNLLLVDGIVVSLRQDAFDVLLDGASILERVEAASRGSPDDPAALLRLATMQKALLPEGAGPAELAAVTATYQRALQACMRRGLPRHHPVREALQRQLFEAAMRAADTAVEQDHPDALQRLVEARQEAPERASWIHVQLRVIERCRGQTDVVRAELDRLEAEAGDAQMMAPNGTTQPVAAFVCRSRAQLPGPPERAVLLWQTLLEQFPEATFATDPARDEAKEAIGVLIEAHGPQVYAAVAARADAALAAAGDDRAALEDLSAHFPNSNAALVARTRLLDRSVREGDLAGVCRVLKEELSADAPSPAVLRRVLVAALVRGNRGLAAAMARELRRHADATSDWPDDKGASYGAALDALKDQLAVVADAGPPLQVPARQVARIKPRTPKESYRLPPLVRAPGFVRQPDEPLYAVSGAELLAIDLHAPGDEKPVLFSLPTQFLEHIVVCGTVLVVPDLERLVGVDYRTGQQRWELSGMNGRLLDSLGVQSGVLHVSRQSTDADGGAEFLGIEPLSGALLFSRTLTGERMKPVPKPVDGGLLVMQTDDQGDAELLRLDPVTGRTVARVRVAGSLLHSAADVRADGLATRIYPQGLCADQERIYLPIDSTFSGDAPRLVAIDAAGSIAWQWQGKQLNRLLATALRGNRIVVVEGAEERPGRIVLLDARTGEVLRSTPLGLDVDVLNWQRTWLPNPAPPAMLLTFVTAPGSRDRSLLCFGVDDDMPSFLEALGADDGEVERQPQFGPDFVTFGVRPAKSGSLKVYALKRADRTGALPDGARSRRWQLTATFGFAAVGPYTVISSADCLLVLGTDESFR